MSHSNAVLATENKTSQSTAPSVILSVSTSSDLAAATPQAELATTVPSSISGIDKSAPEMATTAAAPATTDQGTNRTAVKMRKPHSALPHSKEEASPADLMLIKEREKGTPWSTVRAEYARLTGVPVPAPSLPNRLVRIRKYIGTGGFSTEQDASLLAIKKKLEEEFEAGKWAAIAAEMNGDAEGEEEGEGKFTAGMVRKRAGELETEEKGKGMGKSKVGGKGREEREESAGEGPAGLTEEPVKLKRRGKGKKGKERENERGESLAGQQEDGKAA